MPREARPNLASIQYLRAAAAMAVVFFHANGISQEYFGNFRAGFGAAGVDVFFVVSGFIMWVTASNRAAPEFMRNRIVRIVPLYWGLTLLLYAGWALAKTPPAFADLLKSLLFIPHISARTGEINPLLIVGWTLNFEMFFYALFAASLFFSKAWRAPVLFVAMAGLVATGLLLLPGDGPVQKVYTSPLIIEFALGCLLGIFYQRGTMPRPSVGGSVGCAGLLLLLATDGSAADLSTVRLLHWGLPAFLIVIGALSFEPLQKPQSFLMLLGAASYSVYLVHPIVIAALKDATLVIGIGSVDLSSGFILLAITASISVGIIVYWLVESPVSSILKKHQISVASHASRTSTISAISQRRLVTPEAIAGVVRSVLWMRTKL